VGLVGQAGGSRVLQAAYYYQSFLLSFGLDEPWEQNSIAVWVLDLLSGDGSTEPAELSNLNSIESYHEQQNQFAALIAQRLNSGKALWENRLTFFPHLVLLNEVGSQLRLWSYSVAILSKTRSVLEVFEQFCCKWQSGEFSTYQHEYLSECGLATEVSGESTSVNTNPKKRAHREFYLTDGSKKYFENHVKLTKAIRLHFYPCNSSKTIYIGHIGQHLPL
jgi:hypothetical protein